MSITNHTNLTENSQEFKSFEDKFQGLELWVIQFKDFQGYVRSLHGAIVPKLNDPYIIIWILT